MAEFKLYGDIMPKDIWDKLDEEWLGFPLGVSFEDVQKFLSDNESDTAHTVRINSNGGYISEAFFIFDALRNSGKTITTINDGACNSAAVIPMLAGSVRKAYEHGEMFLHNAVIDSGYFFFKDYLNADDLQKLVNELNSESSRIVDLYVEVTGQPKEVFENLMKAESKVLSEQGLTLNLYTEIIKAPIPELANYMINVWNQKPKNKNEMKQIDLLNKKLTDFLKKYKNNQPEVKNYEHKDADGVVLFTTEKEDESIAVGDAASPDGTFTLSDGRMVTIADGKITEIKEAESDKDQEIADLRAENQTLKDEIAKLTDKVTETQNKTDEAVNLINEMRQIYSNYVPAPKAPQSKDPKTESYLEQQLREQREKRNKK